jgi:hypothetical protein
MSTSNQIGRLIESLSKGMDGGSFNILPMEGGGQYISPPSQVMQGIGAFDRNRESLGGDSPRPTSSLRSDASVDAQLEYMIGKINGLGRPGMWEERGRQEIQMKISRTKFIWEKKVFTYFFLYYYIDAVMLSSNI